MSAPDWVKGDIARWRAEAKDFAKRAAARRRDAVDLRKKRDFLGALNADIRAREYRESRDERLSNARALADQWGLR